MIKKPAFDLWNRKVRKKAISQGEIIDLSSKFPGVVGAHYECPVFCSAGAWQKILAGVFMVGDLKKLVWTILLMSELPNSDQDNEYHYIFDAVIRDSSADWIVYRQFKKLVVINPVFPGDEMIYIYLPEE